MLRCRAHGPGTPSLEVPRLEVSRNVSRGLRAFLAVDVAVKVLASPTVPGLEQVQSRICPPMGAPGAGRAQVCASRQEAFDGAGKRLFGVLRSTS